MDTRKCYKSRTRDLLLHVVTPSDPFDALRSEAGRAGSARGLDRFCACPQLSSGDLKRTTTALILFLR